MSGLFGIVDTSSSVDIDHFLETATNQLSLFPWHTSQTTHLDSGIGLGRIGIGVLNCEPQPVVSADNCHVLLMSGEFYHTETVIRKLKRHGIDDRPRSDPELALEAYLTFGEDFAAELEGVFFICVYDWSKQRLILTNDHLGLYPHYYFTESGRFVFAPTVRGVLCAPFVSKKLNLTALAEYMRFQQLLGTKTFHENIALFPYGSVGTFDLATGQWHTHHYWNWDQIETRPEIIFNEAVEETGYLLRRAVTSLSSDNLRPGVFLSGGLDSRTIIGLMRPRNPPVVSATFGRAGSRDVYYAAKIARAVGSQHHWFDFTDGCWVLDNADLHLKLTEGFHSWMHLHGITMLPELRKIMDYNLTGWDGGSTMGHPLMVTDMMTNPLDDMSLMADLYRCFITIFTWPGMTEAEANMLYAPEYAGQLQNRAFESMMQEFAPYKDFNRAWRPEFFFINNHDARMTGNMIATTRGFLEVRFPYWDYNLMEAMYSYSPQIRSNHRLFRHVITRETPKLSRIPRDSDEFLPTSREWLRKPHSLSVRARRRLGLYPDRPTLYADYENYLRTDLREWAASILFDGQLQQRGLFNMDFVRALYNRHMSGRELWTIGKIAPIITLEMVMRSFFD